MSITQAFADRFGGGNVRQAGESRRRAGGGFGFGTGRAGRGEGAAGQSERAAGRDYGKAGTARESRRAGSDRRSGSAGRRDGIALPEGFGADVFLICVLLGFAFFVNRAMRISGLYMDDLYLWSCFGEQSFREFVFPIGSTRCRFVYWFAAWAELLLVGNRLEMIVPINILLNWGTAAFLFLFAERLSRSRTVSFLAGLLFLASRFAYYQIGQLLGLMETMGTFFALLNCWLLYRYLHGEDRFYLPALLVWFLNCFTHERYMVLLPMFYLALLVRRDKRWDRLASPAAAFVLMLVIRRLMIGTLSPAGTGGTQIAETFTARGAVVNLLVELLYLFGVNAGPEHLCGLPWQDTPFFVKLLIAGQNALLVLFLVLTAADLRHRRRYRLGLAPVFVDALFFLGFLLGCAASSAVTIRVEMRWIYAQYAFLLLLIACLFGKRREVRLVRDADPEAVDRFKISDRFPLAVLMLMAALTIPVQLYSRRFFPKIYLFPNQERYNSLADVTYGSYGPDILGKEIVIVGNTYQMSDFTRETFFKLFDPQRTGQGTTVRIVESLLDVGQVNSNMLVLKEDPPRNRFLDATETVRALSLFSEYGYYRDGWMDEKAQVQILSGATGEIRMHFMYPGNLTGSETITIRTREATPAADAGLRQVSPDSWELPLISNEQDLTFEADSRRIVEFEFNANFHIEPAAEQRSENRLAILVNFDT